MTVSIGSAGRTFDITSGANIIFIIFSSRTASYASVYILNQTRVTRCASAGCCNASFTGKRTNFAIVSGRISIITGIACFASFGIKIKELKALFTSAHT